MSHSLLNKKAIEEMLAAACHFGHKVSKWNPKMRQFIYTSREGIHIFDLSITHEMLSKALKFLTETAAAGKTILLVSTKLHATRLVAAAALQCSCPSVTRKWMPGLLTNYETIRKRIKYFKDLKEQKARGDWDKYTKKERLELQRTCDKLDDAFSGVETMTKLPDVVFVLDSVHDALALREAKRLRIPTVGVCDTNADPDLLTYPIPGNDDAIKALTYFMNKVADAIEIGKKEAEKASAKPNPPAAQPVAGQPEVPVV